MRRKARRLVTDAATLAIGAYTVGSMPTVPGHALNVMPGFNLASVGITTQGAGMALGGLRSLEGFGARKKRRR